MPPSNADYQAKYRERVKRGELRRLDVTLPFNDFVYLKQLAERWHCSRVDALCRIIRGAWIAEGNALDKGETLMPTKVKKY